MREEEEDKRWKGKVEGIEEEGEGGVEEWGWIEGLEEGGGVIIVTIPPILRLTKQNNKRSEKELTGWTKKFRQKRLHYRNNNGQTEKKKFEKNESRTFF